MKSRSVAGLCALALSSVILSATAQNTNPDQCLECHEPAEDWAGMTMEEIVVEAKNPDNKRHADHMDLSDEQLKLIIASLMPPEDLQ